MPIDPIPTNVRELLDVFAAELPDLRFADLDRDALEADAKRACELGEALARAEAAVEAARSELNTAREHLIERSQRALAYARIYADGADDPELVARLDGIRLAVPARRTDAKAGQADLVPRRRGRPPKADSGAALPFMGRPAETSDDLPAAEQRA